MSKTVDNKVVEMEFDNSKFESNVKTSMSTLDKLKSALDFSSSGKSIDKLQSSIDSVDMSPISSAVNQASESFDALEVVAVSALMTITNQAVTAGEQLLSSLTVDQVSAGWEKFGENTKNIGTLVSQGFDLDEVNEQMERLLWYTDETSYNYSDMVNNIGKFTASGQGLEESVDAMEGIANWAALSGQNATTASSAMETLAKAMSTGNMTQGYYRSIQKLNMDNVEFRQKCLDAAVAAGTLKDNLDGTYTAIANGNSFDINSFTDQLTYGCWLTSDVMMDVFGEYASAVDAIYDYSEEKGVTASQAIAEIGDTLDSFGLKAFEAGQEARTFGDVVDSLKDASSTAWMTIFTDIFGDYEQAKTLWTNMSNDLYEVFVTPIYNVEEVLAEALSGSGPLSSLISKIDDVTSATEDAGDAAVDYGDIVKQVMAGDWGTGQERWDALTEAGYDWAYVQNLVNEELGDSTVHATDFDGTVSDLADSVSMTADELAAMSDEELTNLGFTEEEIESLRDLATAAEDAGQTLDDYLANMDEQVSGREKLLQGFKNIAEALGKVFGAIHDAWVDIFPPATSDQVYGVIDSFESFTEKLIPTQETLDKITRTFKGLFSILDVIKTIVVTALQQAFRVLSTILGDLGLDIGGVTGNIGDMITNAHDWLMENDRLVKAIEKVADWLISGIRIIEDLIDKFLQLPLVQKVINGVKNSLANFKEVGLQSLAGLIEGLQSGEKTIPDIIIGIGKSILDTIKNFLGIHSPSTKMIEVAQNCIAGLVQGFKNGGSNVISSVKEIGQKIINAFKNLNIGKVVGLAVSAGLIAIIFKLSSFLKSITRIANSFADIGESVTKVINNVAGVVKKFGKVLSAYAFKERAEGVRDLAIGIGIVAAAIWVLSKLDFKDAQKAVVIVVELAAILVLLSVAMAKLSKSALSVSKEGVKFQSSATKIIGIAAALLIMALALKMIGSLDPEKWLLGLIGLGVVVVYLAIILAEIILLTKHYPASRIKEVSKLLLTLSAAMLIMVLVVKMAGKLKAEVLVKGILFMDAFSGFIRSMAKTVKNKAMSRNISQFGTMILKVSAAMLITVKVMKMVGQLNAATILKGVVFMKAFKSFIKSITKVVSKYKPTELTEFIALMISLDVSMLLMAITMKIVGTMKVEALTKGIAFMAAFGVFVAAIVKITNGCKSSDLIKFGEMAIILSVAMGMLAAIAVLLGFVDTEQLAKGVTAVGILSLIMDGMLAVTKIAGTGCVATIMALTVAVGVMAVSLILLAQLDTKKLGYAALALAGVMGVLAVLIAVAKGANSSLGMLIVMIVAIAAIAASLYILANQPWDSMLAAALSLAAVMIAMAAALKIVSTIDKISTSALACMVIMSAFVVLAALALSNLVQCDASNSLAGAVALAAVMLAMAVVLKITSTIKKISTSALAATIIMSAVVVALAIALGQIKNLETSTILVSAIAISAVLLAMAAALKIISTIKSLSATALAGIAVMSAVVVILAIVFANLKDINPKSMIAIVASLSVLLLAMSAALVIINKCGSLSASGIASLVLMETAVAEIAIILYALKDMNPESALALATGLSEVLIVFAVITFILSKIGSGAKSAIAGAGAMDAVIAIVGGLITGLGALFGQFDVLGDALDTGIEVMKKIGTGIGEFIGGIIGGVIEGATSTLPQVGQNLSDFADKSEGFFTLMSTVGDSALSGVLTLVEIMLALTGAELLNGLTNWISSKLGGDGPDTLVGFGEELEAFAPHLAKFALYMMVVDTNKLKSAAEATETFVGIAKKLPKHGGKLQEFLGDNTLSQFGEEMEDFAPHLVSFADQVKDLDNKAIKKSAKAAMVVTEFADSIPNQGGMLADLMGDNSLSQFGRELATFAPFFVDYADQVGDLDTKAIKRSAKAAMVVTEFAKSIPNEGGLLSELMGDNSIGQFGEELAVFGKGLKQYAKKVTDLPGDVIESSITSATLLSNFADNLPTEPSTLAKFVVGGTMPLSTFGEELGEFAPGLAKYGKKINKVSNWSRVKISADAALVLAEMADTLGSKGGVQSLIFGSNEDINTFGKDLVSFAGSLVDYGTAVADVDIDSIANSADALDALVNWGVSVKDLDNDKISGFGKALVTVAEEGLTGFEGVFDDAYDDVVSCGKTLIENLDTGMLSKEILILDRATEIATYAANYLNNTHDDFYDAGKYLAEGFADGILYDNAYQAKLNATAMANAAAQAAADTLDENSPSKVGYHIGDYFGIGFVNGISDNEDTAYNTSFSIANAAKTGLASCIAMVSAMLDNCEESEPTISPVLDLSNVQRGIGTIDSMFDKQQVLAISSDMDAIYEEKIQNGDMMSNIVSAVKDLQSSIAANSGSNTYHINGITYDDGSNVASAVQSLIRAANIGRRV